MARHLPHGDSSLAGAGVGTTNLLSRTVGEASPETGEGSADLVLHGGRALLGARGGAVVMVMVVDLDGSVPATPGEEAGALGGGCGSGCCGGSRGALTAVEETSAAGAGCAGGSRGWGSAATAGGEGHDGWFRFGWFVLCVGYRSCW